jgi:hypothetical protein
MAVYTYDSPFVVVVHTDSYTGNFEREFCAYVTGVVGDCGKGQNLANEYREDEGKDYYDFWDSLDQVPDDNGCCRPVSLDTNSFEGNSLLIFFQSDPTVPGEGCGPETEFNIIQRRAPLYFQEHRPSVKLLGIEAFKNEVKRVQTKIAP